MLDILRLLMGANPGLLPQGQTGGAAPGLPVPPGAAPSPQMPAPQAPPAGDPGAAGPDIVVGGNQIDKPKLHELFSGGLFQTGKTGGNILGILGDALRAQGGLGAMYAPKLQQVREAEALQNYQSDPTSALDKFLMVNPEKGLGAINTYQDNDRANRATTAVLRDKDTDYENMVHSRVGSMLYSANKDTFPQVLARAKAYADSKGITLDLPATWEEAQSWSKGDVPVKDQMNSDDLRTYRADTLRDRQAANEARAAYYRSNVAERRGYHAGVIANNNPNAKPPTPTTVLGSIQAKVQKSGLPSLSPGERQIYDDSFKGKTGSKGATTGPRIVRDPVTGAVSFAK